MARDPSVWRQRDFVLVVAGGFVNSVGDWLLAVALPAYVYTETASGTATATIIAIELASSIVFGPYGGSLADRWDLKRTVIATNLAQAVTLLPLLAVSGDRIWPAFIVAALQGMIQQVNDPASFAMVPRIVPDQQLVQANAANAGAASLARLVGSPLGGIVVATGGLEAVLIIDAASFGAVAVATSFVRTPTPPLEVDSADNGQGVRAGWRAVRGRPRLRSLLAVHGLAMVTFALFPVLFIAFVVDVLGGDEATIGIIRGMSAFGGLTAAVIVSRFLADRPPTRIMMWGYVALGAVAFAFVNAPEVTTSLAPYLLLFALSGLPNVMSQVGTETTTQLLAPPELLGRVRGLMSTSAAVGSLVGAVAAGLLVDAVDVRLLFNLQAALFVVVGVAVYTTLVRGNGERRSSSDVLASGYGPSP